MSVPILQVAGLCKGYEVPTGRLDVLDDVAFSLGAGEFVSVVGESGSGKSTLLQIVGTLDRPDAGRAVLDGVSLFDLDAARQAELRNRKIGFVYQAHHLIPELNALENVALPLLVRGEGARAASDRAAGLLDRLGLGARLTHTPARLSGGESQRVAVARALVGGPRLLLADEPTGNLDEQTADGVFSALRQLCLEEKAAVLMVTHSLALARRGDRVLELSRGALHPAP